ncbi:MAG: biotin--[acetyl-CoA-carboxylase] ligase [Treponemataceae bacterium]|nr:biotin--[acetyl-CoA-carboxylase] ligase [Treponemataceae bacterium]
MDAKDILLHTLSHPASADGFVSGQELADRCGVSRTSVWKYVEVLRRQGALIEAVTNRGYRLAGGNLFTKDSIALLLPKDSGVRIHFFPEIDSTNTEAKRRLSDCAPEALHKAVFVAAAQTAGRGRMGRAFHSPEGGGVYLSIVYASAPITQPARLTATAAVGVCRALQAVYSANAKIKWVNDVFVNGKKVCGILTEGTPNFETGRIDAAVIGIGVNIVWNSGGSPELSKTAGGVIEGSHENKRSELCAAIISEVLAILDGGEAQMAAAMEEYRRRALLTGSRVEAFPVIGSRKESYFCTVLDVTDDAKLRVRTDSGEIRILESGEVSLHSDRIQSS